MADDQALEPVEFQNRLVAYIDLLGCSNQIHRADEGKEGALASILAVLQALEETKDGVSKGLFSRFVAQLECSHVSDALLLSTPYGQTVDDRTTLLGFLYFLKQFQLRLLGNHRYLCRGYVCAGKMYHKGSVFFGVPYLKAVEMEKKVSDPKIAIDPGLEEAIREAEALTGILDAKNIVVRDCYGHFFVNHIRPPNTKYICDESIFFPRITALLLEQLQTARDGVLEKYRWLERYIDSRIREGGCEAAELVLRGFHQAYDLTKLLDEDAGKQVGLFISGEKYECPISINESAIFRALLGNPIREAIVPGNCLDSECNIRPEKLDTVRRFLRELGAYPSEVERIIALKSGKTRKMLPGVEI